MEVIGAPLATLRSAAAAADCTLTGRDGTPTATAKGWRFTLERESGMDRRMLPEDYDLFLQMLFIDSPAAVVRTARAIYRGAEDYRRQNGGTTC